MPLPVSMYYYASAAVKQENPAKIGSNMCDLNKDARLAYFYSHNRDTGLNIFSH